VRTLTANVPGLSSARRGSREPRKESAGRAVHRRADARHLSGNRLVGIGVDAYSTGYRPRSRHHLLGIHGHAQTIDPDESSPHRRAHPFTTVPGFRSGADVAVERARDVGVAKLPVGELHRRVGGGDAGLKSRVLQRQVVDSPASTAAPSRRRSSVCCGTSVPLEQLAGRSKDCFACARSAFAFCTSGVFSDAGRCCGSGAPYMRQRPGRRRAAARGVLGLFTNRAHERSPALTRSPRSADAADDPSVRTRRSPRRRPPGSQSLQSNESRLLAGPLTTFTGFACRRGLEPARC